MNLLARNYTLLTDQYQISMMAAYFKNNKHKEIGVFETFYRRVPNNGSYTIMAGLDKVIEYIQNIHFEEDYLIYLKSMGYEEDFIDYLRNFKFSGEITALPDGTPAFPNESILTVTAPIIEGQLIETYILATLNGAKEHATGARNIVEAAPSNVSVIDMGTRRADGAEAALDSSKYAIMAGCTATSNVMAARELGMNPVGTQAHSFIEAFDTEIEAFVAYAKTFPDNCILLVDTYDTLRSGIPNAIKTFTWMKDSGYNIDNVGIRIDSGDLAYLSKEARRLFNEAGFPKVKIVLSNGLNAKTIESLTVQGAQFDVLGVGDNISKPEGRMGCVYKLVASKVNDKFIPRVKISGDSFKITNPGKKVVYRIIDNDTNYAVADLICLEDENLNRETLEIVSLVPELYSKKLDNFDLVKLHKTIFKDGELVYDEPSMQDKIDYCNKQMNLLYPEVRRTTKPSVYYVDGTREYVDFKKQLIKQTEENINNEYTKRKNR